MVYELPISLNVYNKIIESEKGQRKMVLFRIKSEPEIGFCLVHGSSDGKIEGGYDLKQLYQGLLKDKLTLTPEIKEVLTISCYGGLQKEYSNNGIVVRSMHDSIETIQAKAMQTIDGECFLNIFI